MNKNLKRTQRGGVLTNISPFLSPNYQFVSRNELGMSIDIIFEE